MKPTCLFRFSGWPSRIRAIAAYRRLPASTRADLPLLYWLLGSSTPAYKMSQHEAAYVADARGPELCANCTYAFQHVNTGDFICSQVRGRIEPRAWCRLWAR